VAVLVPAGQPVTVAIGDTLFRRRGKRIWAASWFHDGSAPGPAKAGYGNNWVVAAIVVTLPSLARLAVRADFTPVTVTRYGKTAIIDAAALTCLWYSAFASRAVQVIVIRDRLRPGPGHHRPRRQHHPGDRAVRKQVVH
jgi:hypothetical protein